jgi:hypothetical protein
VVTCRSRAGIVRRRHEYDRDFVCFFCEAIDPRADETMLPPHVAERRRGQEEAEHKVDVAIYNGRDHAQRTREAP